MMTMVLVHTLNPYLATEMNLQDSMTQLSKKNECNPRPNPKQKSFRKNITSIKMDITNQQLKKETTEHKLTNTTM